MLARTTGIATLTWLLASGSVLAQAESCGLSFTDEAQMLERVEKMDTDLDGSITRDEHETFLTTLVLEADTHRRYIATFDLRDENKDDVLSEAEIRAGIGAPLAD